MSGVSVIITSKGNLETALETQEKMTSLPVGKSLVFESNSEIKFAVSNSVVGATDEIRAEMISDVPSGDLMFSNDDGSDFQAAVGADGNGTDGDLMLRGSVIGQKTFTAYIDDFGVFDRGANGVVQFVYANIVSPLGTEGRVMYENGEETTARHFYTKDNLGSVRQVIDDEGNIVEAVSYQAYGSMVELNRRKNSPNGSAPKKDPISGSYNRASKLYNPMRILM